MDVFAAEIDKVERKIDQAEGEVKEASAQGRVEKAHQLREEKQQLRKVKEQLREEKLLALRASGKQHHLKTANYLVLDIIYSVNQSPTCYNLLRQFRHFGCCNFS